MAEADVIIIGAGASGLMCAIEAGKRGRKVLVLDHANKAGKKILMSGGGRCNFTNYSIEHDGKIYTAEYAVFGDTNTCIYQINGSSKTIELRGLDPKGAAKVHFRSYIKQKTLI
jgi:flavin-dependent dehydrogenase